MDPNCNAYRIGVRGKKWGWSIFPWEVDVSMQKSWILYRCVNKEISLLDFRRSVTQWYSKRHRNLPDHRHNKFSKKESSIDCGVGLHQARRLHAPHSSDATSGDQKRLCVGFGCSPRVQTECKKCILGLCIAGFAPFYEQWNSHLLSKTTRISIRRNFALDIPENEWILRYNCCLCL